jgi:hypothetical protein
MAELWTFNRRSGVDFCARYARELRKPSGLTSIVDTFCSVAAPLTVGCHATIAD